MSLSIPRKRLLRSATSFLPQPRFCYFPIFLTCPTHRRLISFNPFKRRKKSYLDPKTVVDLIPKKNSADRPMKPPKPGDLAPSSIFDSRIEPSSQLKDDTKDRARRLTPTLPSPAEGRDIRTMAAALDPRPATRRRWLRKMVIRDIRGRGRLNRTEKILRSERSLLAKSPLIKTSIKKLYPLARQIAGKPLTEAMVQMRFSKKKAARDVLKHLELARDQAVVVRGMGLGKVQSEEEIGQKGDGKKEEALVVEDKKGKRRTVTDRSAIYVDEAWVGRGPYETASDHRARGRINRLRLPYTSISVVLKEEATRIRLAEERELKRQRKKVWVPLPDRPVTAQRQYPLW